MFNFIIVSWFLTFGIVQVQYDTIDDTISNLDSNRLATVAEIGISANAWNRLTISGSIENYQYKENKDIYFVPYRIDYKIGASFKVIEGLTIDFDHYCDHPVLSGSKNAYSYSSGETKLTFTLSGSTK